MLSNRVSSSFSRRLSTCPATRTSSTRKASTLVGASGRVYTELEVLRLNPRTKQPQIFKAQCGQDLYVYKGVHESVFALSQELAALFSGSNHLRMHTDYDKDQHILVYPYFRDALLGLIQNDAAFPPSERPKILRTVAEAIHEMHSQGWGAHGH